MARQKNPTPVNQTPVQFMCRRLHIPFQDLNMVMAVSGALLELTFPDNWEQLHTGDMTPDEAAALGQALYDEYVASGGCLLGTIFPYISASAPDNALPCDGSSHLRVDYPGLYAMLDTAFIVDADHFVTPDLRGRVVLGAGAGAGLSVYAVNDAGGEESHVLSEAELAVHSHTDLGHTHSEIIAVPSIVVPGELPVPVPAATPSAGVTGLGFANIQTAGSNTAHENRQPYRALKYAVWAR